MAENEIARPPRNGLPLAPPFQGETAEGKLDHERVIPAAACDFHERVGRAVQEAANFYQDPTGRRYPITGLR